MTYLIWSNEHSAWWMPNSRGYTVSRAAAGRYSLEEATRICLGATASQNDCRVPDECIVPCEDEPQKRWVNRKSGDVYFVDGEAVNATNATAGQQMVLYHRENSVLQFVRARAEFESKFVKDGA